MKAVVFANGVMPPGENIAGLLEGCQLVIAANGGTRHCRRMNLAPHAVVGDLDSLDEHLVADLEAGGVKLLKHPARKDQTDLELALDYAVQRGAGEIAVLGALGKRWDMTIGNILLMAATRWASVDITYLEGLVEIGVVRSGQVKKLTGRPGNGFSLIPVCPEALDVTLDGLEYPLANDTLTLGSTRGISNVVTSGTITIGLRRGTLLYLIDRGR